MSFLDRFKATPLQTKKAPDPAPFSLSLKTAPAFTPLTVDPATPQDRTIADLWHAHCAANAVPTWAGFLAALESANRVLDIEIATARAEAVALERKVQRP